MTSDAPVTAPVGARWRFFSAVGALILAFLQAPGLTVADTKYDLTQNPLGFLSRASHLWTSDATFGQVQNQAYGYFFPHGSFFALGDVLGLPGWVTQRLWWAVLIFLGFWGVLRLCEALGVGSRGSRVVGALAFVLAPRVITTLGSISSESLPMMLAPWVLIPLVRVFSGRAVSIPRAAACSALAVAAMGAVNAVATAAATLVAVVWWLAHRPDARWRRFSLWWIGCLVAATTWWLVPLFILRGVSPPFLDYIESAGTTTQWASLVEVLRGTSSWTPFVSPERIAGAVVVTQPAAVIASAVVAAAGMAGLCMRSMPARGRLTLVLLIGLVGMTAGYVGGLASPVSEQVRLFLDTSGAPLRNIHKLEPVIRLPLALGLAQLLAQVPLPGSVPSPRWRRAASHPEREPLVAFAALVLVALTVSTSLAWTGRLAPRGAYEAVPAEWSDAAGWLADHAGTGAEESRALVVPGAPLAAQLWGLTRDEPLQALAASPWAVRDAVPLVPPGAIRALDSVQRLLADGRPSDGLADTLASMNVRYLVMRNDLDPETSRSTRTSLAHQSIENSPGLERVATFGDDIGPGRVDGIVADSDLRPTYPAIEIFEATPGTPAVAGPYTVVADDVPRVQGGPEVLARLNEHRERGGLDPTPAGPVLLDGDARAAGLTVDDVLVTDTPMNREVDFGSVDDHSSALRTSDDPRRTLNLVPDYPVDGAPLVEGAWSGARVSVSSSASDATQFGGASPGNGPAAAVDGDAATSWVSNGLESSVGQWIQLDLDRPVQSGLLDFRTSPGALGSPVKWVEIETDNGTAAARITEPGDPVTVSLPAGTTTRIRVTATETENGSVGAQFGVSDLRLTDYTDPDAPTPVVVRHLTEMPAPADGVTVTGWNLAQELPGRTGCVDTPDRVRCAGGVAVEPEELDSFQRTLSVPSGTAVTPELWLRSRQSSALEDLLQDATRPQARGAAEVTDVRGSTFALTDGDDRTSWTASQDSIEGRAGTYPTVTLELLQPVSVDGLDIAQSLGALPSHPTRIAVNLGTGPQVRDVDADGDTRVSLEPAVTDQIIVSLLDWDDVLDRTALGFDQVRPPGLAEITVLSESGTASAGAAFDPDRPIVTSCATGPTLTIADQLVRTAVSTTAGALATGAPIRASLCEGDVPVAANVSNPVPLPSGSQSVSVDPGDAFVVDSVVLRTAPLAAFPGAGPTPVAVTADEWTADSRRVVVTGSSTQRILVVPESTNPGWVATRPDGEVLTPVIVNGWQQGWILPAGLSGEVTLTFPADTWYRTAIVAGLALLAALAVMTMRRRPSDPATAPTPTWQPALVGHAGLFAAVWVIGGLAALGWLAALTVAVAAVDHRWGARVRGRVLVAIAGLGLSVAGAMLSTGPWRDPDGYVGHSAVIQLAALASVGAVALAALPSFARIRSALRASRRRSATRTGSSTSA
ncbi:alpha-(1-_3)-arabinofuranosyltransferase [Rhodococcus sp. NBC_00294]|uniref:alpha-(1->3)-arabinofuranosyltransferase n=1 Tax=Rhodococcus sp. NBC_00294 TaxID=2976004 RepID=UPI002E284921|nr:alpha-(1->3)-arabinofuranosyltransferase [Rhodococcus sp. NBC_00294]